METLTLESMLTFGKHQGKQIEDAIEDDPDYFTWLYGMIEAETKLEFNDDVIRLLELKKII